MNDIETQNQHFAHHYGAKHPKLSQNSLGLTIGAIGVVFGDIGTSPLYTLRECFTQTGLGLDVPTVYGFLSLIFWALTLVVSLKYASFLLSANNRGEGGIMALAALAGHATQRVPWMRAAVVCLAVIGISLFYGDGMITPAISVLSAVEGLKVVSPHFEELVIPLTLTILVGLFVIQRQGTGLIGRFAGPICLVWFVALALMGVYNILKHPEVLLAVSPNYAVDFLLTHTNVALLAIGTVVLCITGAEALYSDLGHFGLRPIRRAWFWVVFPGLLLNYMGQGALLLESPTAIENPFYMMVPDYLTLPLVVLATLATIIASFAVITGAFSLTNQAIQLGLLPRMQVLHTAAEHQGQIYTPTINWLLLIGVVFLVLAFPSSSQMAAMYGVAVTGTMLMTSLLALVVIRGLWRRSWAFTICVGLLFVGVDLAFFGSTMLKFAHGGWVSVLIGAIIFTVMMTWKKGREVLVKKRREQSMAVAEFIAKIEREKPVRVPGTAIYMAFLADVAPYPLLYNLEHNKVLHDRVILLTIRTEDRPNVPESERLILGEEAHGVWHLVLRYGFMETPRILHCLGLAKKEGLAIDFSDTTFFIGHDRLVMSGHPPMARWRMRLFFWLAHTATSATDFYKLPAHRVLELGAKIKL